MHAIEFLTYLRTNTSSPLYSYPFFTPCIRTSPLVWQNQSKHVVGWFNRDAVGLQPKWNQDMQTLLSRSDPTQWVYDPNKTKTCKHCSWGLTPQQHQAHEVACAHNRRIANVKCQQQQLEADIMSGAISNARCAHTTIQICEHSWLSMMWLFHLTNGTHSSVFAACHC